MNRDSIPDKQLSILTRYDGHQSWSKTWYERQRLLNLEAVHGEAPSFKVFQICPL
jgi:hypothetical protein